jgi:hypothetical protein
MSEVEQRMDAGMDARGRATQGAVAERLPSDRALKASGAADRGDGDDAARAARVRRNAWLLGGCAVFVYLGYIAWMFLHAAGG